MRGTVTKAVPTLSNDGQEFQNEGVCFKTKDVVSVTGLFSGPMAGALLAVT